jgi:Ras-related protein Rab-1A
MTERIIKVVILGDTQNVDDDIASDSVNDDFLYKKPKNNDLFELHRITRQDGINIDMMVWNTWGDKNFRKIAKTHYKNADMLFLVFDIGNEESFNNVDIWIEKIKKHHKKNRYYIILVGNKISDRKISYEHAMQKVHDLKLYTYIETTTTKRNSIMNIFDIFTSKKRQSDTVNTARQQLYQNNRDKISYGNCCVLL